MAYRIRALAVSVAVGALLLGANTSTAGASPAGPNARVAGPTISDVPAIDAPIGRKGGMQNTFVSCAGGRAEPRAVMKIRNPETGWKKTFRWTGALPGLYSPRVEVGTYRVTTKAWCAGVRRVRREKVVIAEKTLDGTMSREEFEAIDEGMSRDQVAEIIGNPGRDAYTYAGSTQVTYDNMRFWAWSIIKYRNDRVVAKYWQVGHD